MIQMIAMFQLITAQVEVPGQFDRLCREKCEFLAVQDDSVKLIDQWLNRTIILGKYAASAQPFVPPSEAPIIDLVSPRGWRIVASLLSLKFVYIC